MTDTLQRQALIRDLARRLELSGPDELRLVAHAMDCLAVLRRPGRIGDAFLIALADAMAGLADSDREITLRREIERDRFRAAVIDDDPAREWATESTVGTVCSDESLAIARTVTAERSDPYETVVVDVGEGSRGKAG